MKATELKEIRDRLGMTQSELANVLGVHSMSISKWELGKNPIPVYHASILDVFSMAVKRNPEIGEEVKVFIYSDGQVYALYKIMECALGKPSGSQGAPK